METLGQIIARATGREYVEPAPVVPPKDPVWIGKPPGIKFDSEDRWGCLHPWPYGTYYVSEPGMIEREMFERLVDYQTKPTFSPEDLEAAAKLVVAEDVAQAAKETAIGREIDRKLRLPYGRPTTVWEMNLVVQEGDEFGLMRMIEFWGERTLVPWTKFDLLFRLPMLRAQAAHLNKLAAAERERLGPEPEDL